MPRGLTAATKRRWFTRGAASWGDAQRSLGIQDQDVVPDRYVCPLCFTVDYQQRTAQFKAFDEAALVAGTLTAEHVPPRSLGGRPLVLTCKDCNDWAGINLDAHARRRENPRDAFLGRTRTKASIVVGAHRLSGNFTVYEGQFRFDVTKKAAHRPDAEAGVKAVLAGPVDSARDITLSFGHDAFHDERARASWLRAGYLVVFARVGYQGILGSEMELVRQHIRDPLAGHIRTFLIDTRQDNTWTDRTLVHITRPDWQRCRGIKVGRYVVCLPLLGDTGLYDRLDKARREGIPGLQGYAEQWEWPTEPTFGVAAGDATIPT